MHPAPSLTEAPPLRERDEPRTGQKRPLSAGSASTDQARSPPTPMSPPARKDTMSSISTMATTNSGITASTSETNGKQPYAVEAASPTFSHAVFSAKDGVDVTNIRRPSRRRTGPLSASQREKAALIRKLGACSDCRRRRVACHPKHHNMSWEDAVKKFKSHSPTQEYAPLAGRPISPAQTNNSANYGRSQQKMDIDISPKMAPISTAPRSQQPPSSQLPPPLKPQLPPLSTGRHSIGSEGRIRTPLPSGRTMDRTPLAGLPGIESLSGDLQSATARIINNANPNRTRYDAAYVLMVTWENEPDVEVRAAVGDLAALLDEKYGYHVDYARIPAMHSPYRWLLDKVTKFINTHDARNTLKILYYAGNSYLDAEREMVLSNPAERGLLPTIRWSGIQHVLEDACSDTLVLMDAAFYPCSKISRQEGVMELVAASAGENYSRVLGRASFTHGLVEELQTRLSQKFRGPLYALSAATLHARLMSNYPKMILDRDPEAEQITSYPSPLHILMSANARLPSILLAPLRRPLPSSSPETHMPGTHLNLTIRLADSGVDDAAWYEWMRLLPEGVREVKCESPFRPTFR